MENKILKSIDDIPTNDENSIDQSLPIFLQSKWFKAFEEHILSEKQQTLILHLSLNSKQASYFPFYSDLKHPIFRKKKLMGMTNYYSCIFSLINYKANKVDVNKILDANRNFLSGFDEIHLHEIYEENINEYIQAFKKIGLMCFPYVNSDNWYHDKIEDFDSFYKRCSKSMRNNTRRAKSKLENEGTYEISITCEQDLENKLKDYHSVYQKSWKHEESHPKFLNQVAYEAAKQNKLRIGLIYHKGNPVAAQMWFVDKDNAYIFKLAYREEYADRSVGNVLTMEMCRHTIEIDKVTCVDFLTGNDNYKSRWMTTSRKLIGLKITNPKRPFGLISTIRELLSVLKKKLNKRQKNNSKRLK